ncbi:divergent protein kinase domain 2A-like [Apostichopus japonicus]|uniref:divergent protein kinase domain 2A-like n=1 Tax=Stichopus japonicus TaxID=307972 RepID=UPI003AB3C7F5
MGNSVWKQYLWKAAFQLTKMQNQRSCLLILILLSVTLGFILHSQMSQNFLEDEYFVDAVKCPACYGTSACQRFRRKEYQLHSYSQFRMFDLVNTKNVHHGAHMEVQSVVFKKLASDEELRQFDDDICIQANQRRGCDVSVAIFKSDLVDIIYSHMLEHNHVSDMSDLVRCPSQRLLDRIYDMYKERQSDGFLSRHNKIQLITTIAINPEPLVLQIFPQSDGWPFPRYLGACGRFIVEEKIDTPLYKFLEASWATRLSIALQVLQIAEKFTDNDLGYALYPTDITLENLAVTDKEEVMFIDAENILVVDREQIRKDAAEGWDIKTEAIPDGCPAEQYCLAFSPQDLCTRYFTDHNYYAFIHGLFGKQNSNYPYGLLHSIPHDVPDGEKLQRLLEECINPSKPLGRFDAFPQLLKLVEKLNRYYQGGRGNQRKEFK